MLSGTISLSDERDSSSEGNPRNLSIVNGQTKGVNTQEDHIEGAHGIAEGSNVGISVENAHFISKVFQMVKNLNEEEHACKLDLDRVSSVDDNEITLSLNTCVNAGVAVSHKVTVHKEISDCQGVVVTQVNIEGVCSEPIEEEHISPVSVQGSEHTYEANNNVAFRCDNVLSENIIVPQVSKDKLEADGVSLVSDCQEVVVTQVNIEGVCSETIEEEHISPVSVQGSENKCEVNNNIAFRCDNVLSENIIVPQVSKDKLEADGVSLVSDCQEVVVTQVNIEGVCSEPIEEEHIPPVSVQGSENTYEVNNNVAFTCDNVLSENIIVPQVSGRKLEVKEVSLGVLVKDDEKTANHSKIDNNVHVKSIDGNVTPEFLLNNNNTQHNAGLKLAAQISLDSQRVIVDETVGEIDIRMRNNVHEFPVEAHREANIEGKSRNTVVRLDAGEVSQKPVNIEVGSQTGIRVNVSENVRAEVDSSEIKSAGIHVANVNVNPQGANKTSENVITLTYSQDKKNTSPDPVPFDIIVTKLEYTVDGNLLLTRKKEAELPYEIEKERSLHNAALHSSPVSNEKSIAAKLIDSKDMHVTVSHVRDMDGRDKTLENSPNNIPEPSVRGDEDDYAVIPDVVEKDCVSVDIVVQLAEDQGKTFEMLSLFSCQFTYLTFTYQNF